MVVPILQLFFVAQLISYVSQVNIIVGMIINMQVVLARMEDGLRARRGPESAETTRAERQREVGRHRQQQQK